jgi:CheY-like chemotaxis protein
MGAFSSGACASARNREDRGERRAHPRNFAAGEPRALISRSPTQIRKTGFDVLLSVNSAKTPTPTRLVVVEDDPDSLEALAIFLGEKYAVFGYASAAEAVTAIDAARPDVLVLDIGMHPVDGVQCLEMIRALPGYRDVPAVALTGFARDVERRRFLDGGFQAVVVKPVLDLAALLGVIDGLAKPAVATAPNAVTELDHRIAITASEPRGSSQADRREPARPRAQDAR